jgi:hypothetical protein
MYINILLNIIKLFGVAGENRSHRHIDMRVAARNGNINQKLQHKTCLSKITITRFIVI